MESRPQMRPASAFETGPAIALNILDRAQAGSGVANLGHARALGLMLVDDAAQVGPRQLTILVPVPERQMA